MQKSDFRATVSGLITILTIMLFIMLAYHIKQDLKPDTTQTEVTVQAGDTLWGIAEANCPNQDPREVINEIEHNNRLGEYLHPGDVLSVPQEVGLMQEASR